MDTVKIYLNYKINNVIKYVDLLTNNSLNNYIELNILENCIYESYKMYIFNAEYDGKDYPSYEYSVIRGILEGKVKKDLIKKDVDYLTSCVYLALNVDKYIKPKASEKMDFSHFLNLYNKMDFKKILRGKSNKLKKLYLEDFKSNLKFNFNEVFFNEYEEIQANNGNSIYFSKLKYKIKGFEKYKEKMISDVSENHRISKELFNIELNNLTFDVLTNLFNGQKKPIIINLSDDFLKKQSNITYLSKMINNEFVKEFIILKFNYSEFVKYGNCVNELVEKGFHIALFKDDLNYSLHSMQAMDYAVFNFTESEKLDEFIRNCKANNVKTIITAADNLEKINFSDTSSIDYYYSGEII